MQCKRSFLGGKTRLKRVVSPYLNWAAAVSLVAMLIGHRALAEHTEANYTGLPRRPISFRGFIQADHAFYGCRQDLNASVAIGHAPILLKGRWQLGQYHSAKYRSWSSPSSLPNCDTQYSTRGRFCMAKRAVSLYLNWTADVLLITVIIGDGSLGGHIKTSYPSVAQRPIALQGLR
jgi:hypothetical protein